MKQAYAKTDKSLSEARCNLHKVFKHLPLVISFRYQKAQSASGNTSSHKHALSVSTSSTDQTNVSWPFLLQCICQVRLGQGTYQPSRQPLVTMERLLGRSKSCFCGELYASSNPFRSHLVILKLPARLLGGASV